jgi:hypothetical protein
MVLTYCEQWSSHNREAHKPLSEERAATRHRLGKLYTALLGDPARPRCFLEFSEFRSVCVEFMDEALRTYLTYSFSEERPNELFVEMAVKRRFEHPTGQEGDGRAFYFQTDGRLFVEYYQVGPTGPSVLVSKEESRTDISRNWEPFPEFGRYDGLARLDRGIPALRD